LKNDEVTDFLTSPPTENKSVKLQIKIPNG